MIKKNKPTKDKDKASQKGKKKDQETKKDLGQYGEDPEKVIEITDDPEGTKHKIPDMKS